MKILYHYCSTQTFYSIVSTQTVWLTALSQSNDSKEGRLVAEALIRRARAAKLDEDTCQKLSRAIAPMQEGVEGLGICLSMARDLLSQWRGYADNGAGVCIGFSKSYLDWLRLNQKLTNIPTLDLFKVSYDVEEHDALVDATFVKLITLIKNGAFSVPKLDFGLLQSPTKEEQAIESARIEELSSQAIKATITLLFDQYRLKNPAFAEEQEWRLIKTALTHGIDRYDFRLAGSQIARYLPLKLNEIARNPIVEVLLGPKHTTPVNVIRDFLNAKGFQSVQVEQSALTYR